MESFHKLLSSENENSESSSQIDENGLITLPNGVKIINRLTTNMGNTINEHIIALGYNANELYFAIPKEENNGIKFGLWRLFANDLICIIRKDENTMTEEEVQKYFQSQCEKPDALTNEGRVEIMMSIIKLEGNLESGIENQSISQSFLEKVFGKQCVNNKLTGGGYNFTFENGFLSAFNSQDGYNAIVRSVFSPDLLQKYYSNAQNYYRGNEEAVISEINRQGDCFGVIPQEILKSNTTKEKFAYNNGAVNFIALVAHFDLLDITQNEFIDSTHNNYEVLSTDNAKGIRKTRIKAYGCIFEFTNGHSRFVSSLEVNSNENSSDSAINSNNEGYVYVLINPSMEGLVKIGKTTKDPKERAKELSAATGVATPFIVAYYRKFNNCHEAEKAVHLHFESVGVRYNSSREFFEIQTHEAVEIISNFSDADTVPFLNTSQEYNIPKFGYDESLGSDFYFNFGREQLEEGNTDLALGFFRVASELNHIRADREIGKIYEDMNNEINNQILAFQKGIDKSDNICFAKLGYLYVRNDEIRDIEKADEYYSCFFSNLSRGIEQGDQISVLAEVYKYISVNLLLGNEIDPKYHTYFKVCRDLIKELFSSSPFSERVIEYLFSLEEH